MNSIAWLIHALDHIIEPEHLVAIRNLSDRDFHALVFELRQMRAEDDRLASILLGRDEA